MKKNDRQERSFVREKKMKSFCRSFADKKIKLNGIIYYHDVNNLKCSKVIYLNILSMYSAIGFRAKKMCGKLLHYIKQGKGAGGKGTFVSVHPLVNYHHFINFFWIPVISSSIWWIFQVLTYCTLLHTIHFFSLLYKTMNIRVMDDMNMKQMSA